MLLLLFLCVFMYTIPTTTQTDYEDIFSTWVSKVVNTINEKIDDTRHTVKSCLSWH